MSARTKSRRGSPLYLPSAFDLFKPSKELVLKHIGIFGPLFILPFLNLAGSWNTNPGELSGRSHWQWQLDNHSGWGGLPFPAWGAFLGIIALWGIIWLAATIIVQIMTQKAQLDVVEDRTPTFHKLWQTTKKMGWRMLGLYLAIIGIVLIGLVLFIVPGLFMIRRYLFAPYVMLEKNCSIKEALKRSHELSLKNTGAVWGLMGVEFLIILVNIIPLIGGLTSFVLSSLYSVAPALRYQQLKKLAV